MSDHGQWLESANRIVVKIGSNSVTGKNEGKIDQLVDALATVMNRGAELVQYSLPLLQPQNKTGARSITA